MVITAKDREQEKEEGREKNREKQPGKDREEEQKTKTLGLIRTNSFWNWRNKTKD